MHPLKLLVGKLYCLELCKLSTVRIMFVWVSDIFSLNDAIFASKMLLQRHAFTISMNIWSTLTNLRFNFFFSMV